MTTSNMYQHDVATIKKKNKMIVENTISNMNSYTNS